MIQTFSNPIIQITKQPYLGPHFLSKIIGTDMNTLHIYIRVVYGKDQHKLPHAS